MKCKYHSTKGKDRTSKQEPVKQFIIFQCLTSFLILSVGDICIIFNLIDNCRQKLDRYYFLVRKYASMYTKGTFFLPLPTESYL